MYFLARGGVPAPPRVETRFAGPPSDRGVVVGVGFSDFRGRLLPLLEQA